MTTRKPLIALTPNYSIEKEEPYMRPAYIRAVQHTGGIPVILPLNNTGEDLEQIAGQFDGFLFTGGPDVHPFYFGEQTRDRCGNVSPKRDILELALLKLVLQKKKPVLGICRGIQLFNIGLGGDIYQDISSQFSQKFPVAHSQPFYYDVPSHTVDVVPGTMLDRIAGEAVARGYEWEAGHGTGRYGFGGSSPDSRASGSGTPESGASGSGASGASGSGTSASSSPRTLQVNSMHHQAVRKLAPGLVAAAYAPEGLVEALEMPDYAGFFLGVQWHPEYLWEKDAVAAGIFQSFVDAARR